MQLSAFFLVWFLAHTAHDTLSGLPSRGTATGLPNRGNSPKSLFLPADLFLVYQIDVIKSSGYCNTVMPNLESKCGRDSVAFHDVKHAVTAGSVYHRVFSNFLSIFLFLVVHLWSTWSATSSYIRVCTRKLEWMKCTERTYACTPRRAHEENCARWGEKAFTFLPVSSNDHDYFHDENNRRVLFVVQITLDTVKCEKEKGNRYTFSKT